MKVILSKSDPSWWPRFLAVIDRDYPKIAREVLSTAVSENAADIKAREAGES